MKRIQHALLLGKGNDILWNNWEPNTHDQTSRPSGTFIQFIAPRGRIAVVAT